MVNKLYLIICIWFVLSSIKHLKNTVLFLIFFVETYINFGNNLSIYLYIYLFQSIHMSLSIDLFQSIHMSLSIDQFIYLNQFISLVSLFDSKASIGSYILPKTLF